MSSGVRSRTASLPFPGVKYSSVLQLFSSLSRGIKFSKLINGLKQKFAFRLKQKSFGGW